MPGHIPSPAWPHGELTPLFADLFGAQVRREDELSLASLIGLSAVLLGPIFDNRVFGDMLRALFSVLKDECPGAVLLNNLALYANSISSTIPTVLAHIDEILDSQGQPSVQQGDLIILPAAGICMESRATHLSQGWAVIEW